MENYNNKVKKHQSFREAVVASSQWFDEARKIVSSSTEWEDVEEIPPDGDLTVQFSKVMLEILISSWKLSLMGKCMGLNVRSSYMEARVRSMWRCKGNVKVIDLGK